MSTTKDSNSLHINLSGHSVPKDPAAPYPPSLVEAEHFFYGLYSKPRLIARSSIYVWVEPRSAEAYLTPKELMPLGFGHPLENLWEHKVGPEMVSYLDDMGVKCSSLDPVRIGYAGDPFPPAIVWVGVLPGTLTAEAGVNVAVQCKNILSANGINDVHVELRESEVFRCAQLYKPVPTSFATVRVIEPFSTAVGLPISTEDHPASSGTGGFFISDPRHPGELFLVTARHVITPPNSDDNELIKYSEPFQNVLLFSESAAKKFLAAIESEIGKKEIITRQLEKRLKAAGQMEPEYAEAETDEVEPQLKKAEKHINDLQRFLHDATRDLSDRRNRVIGHVVLSPPIALNVGDSGFTEDWAVIKVDASKINSTNFVGNVIDLGIDIPVDKFTSWMYPNPANPPSFDYPGNRLHKFSSFIPDKEMWKPNPNTRDHEGNSVIMVIKRGYASGLTVGRLNTIRSFTRHYYKDKGSIMSKEITVLPRNSKSGPFSTRGDSGSSVVDGKGRIAGLLMGGSAGVTGIPDCTYVTSINFLCERMARHGLKANFFPSLTAKTPSAL